MKRFIHTKSRATDEYCRDSVMKLAAFAHDAVPRYRGHTHHGPHPVSDVLDAETGRFNHAAWQKGAR